MSEGKVIAGFWSVVTVLYAVVWSDTKWRDALIGAYVSALVGLVGALSKSRWAGAVLMIGSLALGAAVLFVARGFVPVAHGGGNIRNDPFAVVIACTFLFVFPLIAVFSFVIGLSRFSPKAPDEVASSLSQGGERNE